MQNSGKAWSRDATAVPRGVAENSIQELENLQAKRIWTRTAQSAVNAQLITETEVVGGTFLRDKHGMGLSG